MSRNIRLYPWFQFFRNLTFWQAIWFLYFQETLSANEAILLYAVFDVATTGMEVPSGYLSDRVGRRITLLMSAVATVAGLLMIVTGDSFTAFAMAQVLLGAGAAFASGTDSAILYESLVQDGRQEELEAQEIKAWRFSFTALAVSAVIGGALADTLGILPFLASALAGIVAAGLILAFREPAHRETESTPSEGRWFRDPTARPVLMWIFSLSVVMYIFSHVPFVFGQPFILEALTSAGLQADAPLISGGVTSAMMIVSIATSWAAPAMRRTLGLTPLLLFAFSIQIGLIVALALSNDTIVIAFLLLRMVPNSLARPFILARIQPLLADKVRATYLSMQSFAGRLLFAGTLVIFSFDASAEAEMDFSEIQSILLWYAVGGCVVLVGLIVTQHYARSARR